MRMGPLLVLTWLCVFTQAVEGRVQSRMACDCNVQFH